MALPGTSMFGQVECSKPLSQQDHLYNWSPVMVIRQWSYDPQPGHHSLR